MKTDGGDCYQAAGIYLMDAAWHADIDVDKLVLVHGLPTLTRPPFTKHGHAWIEYDVGGTMMVRDVANGRNVEAPACAYYSAGSIDPEECIRYSFADMKKKVNEFNHWGPWDSDGDSNGR